MQKLVGNYAFLVGIHVNLIGIYVYLVEIYVTCFFSQVHGAWEDCNYNCDLPFMRGSPIHEGMGHF